MPSEPPKVRIFSMDEKVSREKLNKLLEELAHITCKDGEPIKNLKDSDKERALELFEKIEDILRKSPEVQSSEDKRIIIPQSILIYIARASLYMHAQTYFHIVQSVTNTFLGRVDLELNNYYQMIVDGINHLLTLDECKDFPGEFKPFNENIFPETGILKIGWKGFAPDCADFLSKAQKYFHDTPEPPENVITSPIYFKYLSQKHSAIIEKAHEYASKVKRLCDEHNKKETTPPKESIIHKHKKPMEAGQEIKLRNMSWKPPKGYIGSKAIVNNYNIPRSTLQGWAERDKANVKKDPMTKENYYQKKWLEKCHKKYKPRSKA